MDPENNDAIDELIQIESKFINDYEEMNKFIIFFKKIKDFLVFNENIEVLEINKSHLKHKITKILPFYFSLLINKREFIFFMKNDSTITLTEKELAEYRIIFTKHSFAMGLFIVFNDQNLSSIKLLEAELYGQPEKVLKKVKEDFLPLKQIIEKEISESKSVSDTLEKRIPEKQKSIELDLNKEFRNSLYTIFQDYNLKKFKSSKKEILDMIAPEDLKKILNFFTDFYLGNIKSEELRKKLKNLLQGGVKK